jgi:alpha-beta hydrolase superfamily lysophospholipase
MALAVCYFFGHAQSKEMELSSDFSEREIVVHTSSGNLYGTLVIPVNNELGIIALIIPDFGLTDRDGNSPQAGENNSLKMLAEDLAREGISTLRLEKREVSESKNSAIVKSGVRIEDMAEDAVSWLRFLKKDSRFNKIVVVGHGEGALVGMLASEIADIEYFVSIAGLGRPGYDIVEENLISQLASEQMDTARMYIEELKKGIIVEDVAPSLASIFNRSMQSYLASWFKYNPTVEIANLKANVLLVQGTDDLQVNSDDIVQLSAAFSKAKEVLIEGMNHTLRDSKEEKSGSKGENPQLQIADGLVKAIADFLKE